MMTSEHYVDYGEWRVDDGNPSGVRVAATSSTGAPAFLLYVDDAARPNQLVQVLIPSVTNHLSEPLWGEADIGCQRTTPDEYGEDYNELYVRTVTETDEPAKGQTLVTIWSGNRDQELNIMMESVYVFMNIDDSKYVFSMAEAVNAAKKC